NWTKMTTLVAVVENGQMTFEPKEMTYRSITYYLEDSVAKVMQPGGNSATAAASAAATTPAVTKPSITPVKMEVANATPPSPVAGTATPNNAPASNAAGNAATKNPAANNTAAPATNKAAKPAAATPAPASATITATSAAPLSTNTATASNLTLKATEPLPPPANQNTDAPAKAETEAPAKPLRGVPVKPISGGVLNGKALELPKPDYPEIARRARASGLVSVEVVIDLNGKVIAAKAVSGPSMLQRAAEQAALRARFTPTLLSGQPVKMTGTINYNFSF
ncbi:MAG: energy transducer TonB, partial [Pyrinomonadaceae bacterium]|nr:energy transducer TonB [Pyrinomonadaceae bacterium]